MSSAARCAIRRCRRTSCVSASSASGSRPSSPTRTWRCSRTTVSTPALVTHEVEKILGRPAQTFADAIRPHRAPVRQLVKETTHVRASTASVPQADEPRRQGDAAAGHPHRARDDPDRARQEDRQAPQHADDTVHLPRRLVHRRRISRSGLGGERSGRGCGHADPWAQVAARSRSSNSTREESRPVLREFPAQVPVGVGFAKRSGLVREGTPDEFEALAGQLAVFRFDPAG